MSLWPSFVGHHAFLRRGKAIGVNRRDDVQLNKLAGAQSAVRRQQCARQNRAAVRVHRRADKESEVVERASCPSTGWKPVPLICTSSPVCKSAASAAGISALTASRLKSITSATVVFTSTASPGLTLRRVTVPDSGATTCSAASCASASCKFFNDVFCWAYNFFCRSASCPA